MVRARAAASTSTCSPAAESVFALSNGHVGLRGNLDEGEPHALPGTYLNSVYELGRCRTPRPATATPSRARRSSTSPTARSSGCSSTTSRSTSATARCCEHERVPRPARRRPRPGDVQLALAGRSRRSGSAAPGSSRSPTARSSPIAYEVEPLDDGARIVLQSELVANEELPGAGKDPRVGRGARQPAGADGARRRRPAAAAPAPHPAQRHRGRRRRRPRGRGHRRAGRATSSGDPPPTGAGSRSTAALRPGQTLRLVKFVSYGWSSVRSRPALRDQVAAGLTGALHTGWEGLLRDQREFLDEFWQGADVTVEGDPALQQAVRFALFHVLQNSARAEERPIAAKGLTGPGYDGHCFWDTDSFVLPVLVHTWPEAAADHLRWRHRTLDAARHRAAQLRLAGAAFPWRTINGEECSGYWPAGTAAFHVNADIADAVIRYHDATRDDEFDAEVGLELLVETARLWVSLGHHDRDGGWHISGVTGPDEYSASPTTTSTRTSWPQRNLRAAAAAVRHRPERAGRPGRDRRGGRGLARAADAVVLPFDEELGVHEQSAGFTAARASGTSSTTPPDAYPLLLHYPYFDLYRKQVVKQADLVLAMQTRGDRFTPEQKAAQLRLLRGDHRARLVAVGVHAGRAGGRGRAASTSPTPTPARRRSWTCTTSSTTPATACTWRRWRAPGSRSSPASAGCATTAGGWSSRRACPTGSPGCRSPSATAATGCGSRRTAARRRTRCSTTTREIRLRHHGKELLIRSGEPVTAPVPPPPKPAAGHPAARPGAAAPSALRSGRGPAAEAAPGTGTAGPAAGPWVGRRRAGSSPCQRTSRRWRSPVGAPSVAGTSRYGPVTSPSTSWAPPSSGSADEVPGLHLLDERLELPSRLRRAGRRVRQARVAVLQEGLRGVGLGARTIHSGSPSACVDSPGAVPEQLGRRPASGRAGRPGRPRRPGGRSPGPCAPGRTGARGGCARRRATPAAARRAARSSCVADSTSGANSAISSYVESACPRPCQARTISRPYTTRAGVRPRHIFTAGWLRQPYSPSSSARSTCRVSTRCLPSRGLSRTWALRAKSR